MFKTDDTGVRKVHVIASLTIQAQCFLEVVNQHIPATLHPTMEEAFSLAYLNTDHDRVLLIDVAHVGVEQAFEELGRARLPARTYPALMNVRRDAPWVADCVLHGVRGLFFDDDHFELVLRGINSLIEGAVWISRETLLAAATQPSRDLGTNGNSNTGELTRREQEILGMICVGATNQEIADKLFISTNTVKTHIYKIYKKIHVPNRMQAALWGAKHL